jgi:hypothetical protein
MEEVLMKRVLLLTLVMAMTMVLAAQPSIDGGKSGLNRIVLSPTIDTSTVTVSSDGSEISTGGKQVNVHIFSGESSNDDDSDRAFFGVVTENITLDEARTMNYTSFYGILVTEVVRNSPAQFYGIRHGDVLMEIDGEKIKNTDSFSEILGMHKVNDKVTLKFYRDGEIKTIDFVLGSKEKEVTATTDEGEDTDSDTETHSHYSVGSGGGGWIPMWYMPDLDDANTIFGKLGFDSLRTDGLFMNGFGGQGNVGKGWFLGGYGVWYSSDRNTNFVTDEGLNTIRRLRYSVGFGGVTLDKRVALSSKLIASAGFLLGWGGTRIQCDQFDGDFSWDTIDEDIASSDNNHLNLSKHYIMIQPKVSLMYRINSWLSMRAEGGYLAGYSYTDGWDNKVVDQNYQVSGSPDTSFNGWTISVGPWFGF